MRVDPFKINHNRIALNLVLILNFFYYSTAHSAERFKYYTDQQLEEEVYLSEGYDIQTAMDHIADRLRTESNSAFLHYLLSQLYIKSVKRDPSDLLQLRKAKMLAEQSYDLAPNEEYSNVALANFYNFVNQDSQGISILANFTKLHPKNVGWRTYLCLAQINTVIANYDGANFMYNKALESAGAPLSIVANQYNNFILNYISSDQRLTILERIRKKHPNIMFEEFYAFNLLQNKQIKKAEEVYRKIVQKNNKRFQPYANLGILIYQNKKKDKDAIKYLNKALSNIHPDDTFSRDNLLLHKAMAYASMYDYHNSLIILKDLYSRQSFDQQTLSFIKLNYKNSIDQYAILLDNLTKERGSSLLFAVYAEALTELNQNLPAIQNFKNAITIDQNNSEYYNLLGIAYYKLNRYDEALTEFSTATKIDPENSLAYYNLACVMAIKNQQIAALEHLQSAIKINPSLSIQAIADVDLKNIHHDKRFLDLIKPNIVQTSH